MFIISGWRTHWVKKWQNYEMLENKMYSIMKLDGVGPVVTIAYLDAP